jgi:hypothetical protein
MKKPAIIQRFGSLLFTAMLLFTVGFHEVHHLFSEHHTDHNECDNHLHSPEEHGDCSVCDFQVLLFTVHKFQVTLPFVPCNAIIITGYLQAQVLQQLSPTTLLRGPPFLQ